MWWTNDLRYTVVILPVTKLSISTGGCKRGISRLVSELQCTSIDMLYFNMLLMRRSGTSSGEKLILLLDKFFYSNTEAHVVSATHEHTLCGVGNPYSYI